MIEGTEMKTDSVTRYTVIDGKWSNTGVVTTLKYEEVGNIENFTDGIIFSTGVVHTFIKDNVEVKIGESLGTFPVRLRPASSRNFIVSSKRNEIIRLEINNEGVVRVVGIDAAKGVRIEEKVISNENFIEYDLMDRKEIEVVERVSPGVVISIPKKSTVKIGDVVGKVMGNLVPVKDKQGFIFDVKGGWVKLKIDCKGEIKVEGVGEVEGIVSWNQSIIRYRTD